MKLIVEINEEEASQYAANCVVQAINKKNPGLDNYFVLGLPTGYTPLKMYDLLVEAYKEGKVSFKFVKTFNTDEFIGIPKDSRISHHKYMWDHLFKHIDIQPQNANIPDGTVEDLEKECESYEKKILAAGGIDLFVCGIGADGHIACNEPCSSLKSRTRVKTMTEDTFKTTAQFLHTKAEDLDKMPRMSITVGVGTVFDSKAVLVIVCGSNKALALHHIVEKGFSHMWTASVFQHHPETTIVCDEEATGELKVKTVRYFVQLRQMILKLAAEKTSRDS
eukprot:CFRG5856T1